jgi:hypothetical protein
LKNKFFFLEKYVVITNDKHNRNVIWTWSSSTIILEWYSPRLKPYSLQCFTYIPQIKIPAKRENWWISAKNLGNSFSRKHLVFKLLRILWVILNFTL